MIATLEASVRHVLDNTIEALVVRMMRDNNWQQRSLNKSSPYRECNTPSMSRKITVSAGSRRLILGVEIRASPTVRRCESKSLCAAVVVIFGRRVALHAVG